MINNKGPEGQKKCKFCGKWRKEFVICNDCYASYIVENSQHILWADKTFNLDTIKFRLEDIESKIDKLNKNLEGFRESVNSFKAKGFRLRSSKLLLS